MKRMLLIICMLFLFTGHIFSQPIDPPNSLSQIHGVCWAKRNVDKPGTFAETFEEYGMLYQWETSRGWIATNFFTGGDTTISTKDPCPVGWRMPTVEETKSLYKGDGVGGTKVIEASYIYFGSVNSLVYFPIGRWIPSYNPVGIPKSGYWSGSVDTNDPSKAWAFFFTDGLQSFDAIQQLVPRDYPLLVRCVADTECDSIVTHDTVTICSTDLPYEWNDTTFREGTKTGTYCLRFRPNTCGCMNIAYLHLTVEQESEKSCPGVLINEVCWAKYNVDEPGRFANPGKPYGMLYQWNRKKGWPVTGNIIGWDSSLEPGDTWEPANDPCPVGWRMPTVKEIKTLLDRTNVSYIETAQDKALGTRYTDVTTGNTVFFPQANIRKDDGLKVDMGRKYYWSNVDHWTLYWNRSEPMQQPYADGYSVRCVADENACDIVLTASENICKEALPYTWHDTTFQEGTVTGEYCIRRTNQLSGCDSIYYLYLTVDTLCGKPCKERGVLINGVCWAESNVNESRTFAESPEALGQLYQWNRKKGLPLKGEIASEDWTHNIGDVRWEAVNNPCPADWRIPTKGEIYTLLDDLKVEYEWTQQNGVNGIRFTDKTNGNTVFLPASGSRLYPFDYGTSTNSGEYWSTTENNEQSVYALDFSKESLKVIYSTLKSSANSVRCVVGRDMPDCDSIVTNTSVTVCTKDLPYEWGDTIFDVGTKSGVYRFQYISVVTGCDSIVNLHLTVDECEKPCPGVLINGVCWAESNVDESGTFAAAPEASGMLYQWNRRKGWPATGEVSGWDNSFPSGKYWEAANDPCPAGWRVPTVGEIDALLDNVGVTSIWILQNGVYGRKFTDNVTGNTIFLPSVSSRIRGELDGLESSGWYWSSSIPFFELNYAITLYFFDTQFGIQHVFTNTGNAVRCVADENVPACADVVTDTYVSICANDLPYEWGDTTFDVGTVSGVYRFQYISVVTGCDSIVNLHLTVDKCEKPCPGVLINDVCWAEYNVDEPGTFAATSEASGLLYQWNRRKGWPTTGEVSGWDSSLPSGECWEAANDPCPVGWRVPTLEEAKTLLDTFKVSCETISQNGVLGYSFMDISNSTTLFLPKSAYRSSSDGDLNPIFNQCYWLGTSSSNYFAYTFFYRTDIHVKNCGLSVRCVFGNPPGCGSIVTDTSLTVCANDLPYEWGDTTFDVGTVSGVYRFLHTSAVTGCDSIVNLHLTVHASDTSFFDAVCYGKNYDDYGFHLPAVYHDTLVRDTFRSVWGCDSIRILSLSVHPVYETPLYDTICQGDDYNRHGFSLSNVQTDAVYTLSLSSRAGCDSTLILHLKIHPVYDTTLYDSICPSAHYERYGFRLSNLHESGTYRRTLPTVHGCDSTVTLHLHVWPTYFYPKTVHLCEGDTFDFRGRRYHESGIYYDSLSTVRGCDSIYCLYLSVHPVYDLHLSGVLCEGSPYTQNGFHATTPGMHYRYLQSTFGCDSTITLTLTEEKKITGAISLLLEDCSLHGYSFFFEPGDQISRYQWDLGDGTILRTEEGYHQYADSGTYRIQLHTETYNDCENHFTYIQYVPPYLQDVPIHSDRQVIDEDYPTVRFHAVVLPGMTCRWDFGDGVTATGDSVSHTYNATTEPYYDVRLQILNSDSCVTESGLRIEVVFLPKTTNTFSPNGDGINDIFMPDYRLEIIDRNGLRIFTGESGWDGTYKGSPAKEDTYFYLLHYRTSNGERQKTGYVTLIR